MSAAEISVNKQSQDRPRPGFVYDALLRGFDDSFWKTIANTVSVASNKIRLASGGAIASYPQYKYGIFRFALNVPTTPSAGEDKKWGLLLPGAPTIGSIYFEISGATFRARSYDEDGNVQTTNLTWSSYEAVETVYEIEWAPDLIIFKINGTAVATHLTRVGNIPLPLYLINSDADNTDLGYIAVKETTESNVGSSSSGSTVNVESSIEASSGTSSSGKQTVDTTAGGTQVLAANANRAYAEFTNTGSVDCYYASSAVTSSSQVILPGQTKTWFSQEALKVLSSSGSVDIKYVDYINS